LFSFPQKKGNANAQTAHLQTAQAAPQTKVCKRAIFTFPQQYCCLDDNSNK
jgi:hypothetical protein